MRAEPAKKRRKARTTYPKPLDLGGVEGAAGTATPVAQPNSAQTREIAPVPSTPAGNPLDALADMIVRWRAAPWVFVAEVFGAIPDPWQDEMLHALVGLDIHGQPLKDGEGQAKIYEMFCLKACKGPGKSCLLAWIIWWFLLCFEFPKILCTSITFENLRDGLWSELAKWKAKSELIQAMFEQEGERIYAKGYKETWFCAARTWPKDADKTKQADTLAGQHAKNTMIVLDEGGGIPVGVLAAGLAHHSTQGHGEEREIHITLMAGNPTNLDSALGWACTENAKHWWIKEISGDPADPMRAPRIDPKWAQKQIDDFGADNPWVLVNVFGRFPPVQANKLLGPDQVSHAMRISFPSVTWAGAPRIMGLDVARSLVRDRSSLCRRQGRIVFPFKWWRTDNLMFLVAQVIYEFNRWPAEVIFVDMLGPGGGVLDRLKELGLPAIGINSGLPSADPRFADKRTEMWWNGAKEIKNDDGHGGISLPESMELRQELTAPVLEFTDKGKMKLESKEKMLRRGIDSPDLADSLMFTWAEPMQYRTSIPESEAKMLRSGRIAMCATDWDPFEDPKPQEIE